MLRFSIYRTLVLILATTASLLILKGCGGGDDGDTPTKAPTLTNVTVTPNSVAAGLTIDISGTFTFTDPDGDLNGGSFNYTYDGVTYSFPLPADLAGVTSATIMFALQAVLNSDTGTGSFPCWLVDGAGNQSNVFDVSFTQLWTRQFGTASEDIGHGITIDSTSSVLIAGSTLGLLDGEANPGSSSVFVAKFAPDTTRAWTRVLGSAATDNGRAVAHDSQDNVYVVGDTLGATFDGLVTDGTLNGFVTKLDSSGDRQWTNLISTLDSERAYSVAVDGSNNVYVAGTTTGDLDGEANTSGWDAFLVKFDSNGNRLWTRLLGSTGSDTAYGVTVDGSGNVYVTGSTDGVLGTDPSPGDPSVNFDAFVAKYDPAGNNLWVTQLGTSCSEWTNGVALGVGGNLYVGGMIISCAFPGNTASGLRDAFVAYLDDNGVLQWVRQLGTAQYDTAYGVTTDSTGNAYVTGFLDSVSFNDDNEGHTIFLAKYDSAGNQAWLMQDDASYSWGNQGRAAATDPNGSVFVTGTVHGQLDGHINPNLGEDDVFILKFDSDGTRR